MTSEAKAPTLAAAASAVMAEPDPARKTGAALTLAHDRRTGGLAGIGLPVPVARPKRPARPELRPPREMPRRRNLQTVKARVALLHALAHIEFNGIDLACDMIARFADFALPPAYYDDWCTVAGDEARHQKSVERRQGLRIGRNRARRHPAHRENEKHLQDGVARRKKHHRSHRPQQADPEDPGDEPVKPAPAIGCVELDAAEDSQSAYRTRERTTWAPTSSAMNIVSAPPQKTAPKMMAMTGLAIKAATFWPYRLRTCSMQVSVSRSKAGAASGPPAERLENWG